MLVALPISSKLLSDKIITHVEAQNLKMQKQTVSYIKSAKSGSVRCCYNLQSFC